MIQKIEMFNLFDILKFVESRHGPTAALIQKLRFLAESTAHRSLIRRYMSASGQMERNRVAEARCIAVSGSG